MEAQIKKAIYILKKGGLVIFPSDTVYGALVDATNKKAIEKLIRFKSRPPGKAISVFISDFKMLKDLVIIDKKQDKVLQEILPGPFTIILKSKHKICNLLESEKKTLGIRLPKNLLINKLIKKYGKPVTATSANLSGQSPCYSVESLMHQLSDKKKEMIDLIVDIGKIPHHKPSTVIDLTTPTVKVLRKGDLDFKRFLSFFSKTPDKTKKISQSILRKNFNYLKKKPLIFIIKGELGVGKTVFVKGIGEMLGIENIVSPSYVIYYEYLNDPTLIHVDLYNIEDEEEFRYLGLEKYFKPRNIICFEWGEKTREIYDELKKAGRVIFVEMEYVDEKKRKIIVKNL